MCMECGVFEFKRRGKLIEKREGKHFVSIEWNLEDESMV